MDNALLKIIEHIPDPLPESNKLPIMSIGPLGACELFYKLVFLDQIVTNMDDDRQRLNKVKREYDQRLAIALKDYVLLTLASELRHYDRCVPIKNPNNTCYIPGFSDREAREHAMVRAMPFIPKTIIQIATELFDTKKYDWQGGWGGSSWYKIATAADLYGSVSNERFIDTVWNLRHNGNLFFDKSTIFIRENDDQYSDKSGLRTFLERRASNSIDTIWTKSRLNLDKVLSTHKRHFTQVINYIPIGWGENSMQLIYKQSNRTPVIKANVIYTSSVMKKIKSNKSKPKKSVKKVSKKNCKTKGKK